MRSIKLIVVVGLCLMPAACGSKPSVSEAQKAFAHGYHCLMVSRDWATAQLEFEKVVQLEPDNASAWRYLGLAYLRSGKYDDAVRCFQKYGEISRAAGDQAALAASLNYTAMVYSLQGNYADAATSYQETLDVCRQIGESGRIAEALNNYAWLLATARDDAVRNGDKAVQMATEALDLDAKLGVELEAKLNREVDARQSARTTREEQIALHTDTLAAAYAETGNFDEAVRLQEEVVNTLRRLRPRRPGRPSAVALYEHRLRLYKRGEQYRE